MAKKILIVEDDQDIRNLYYEILSSEGYEVISASSGEEALEKLRFAHRLPCLVLTDFMMPNMNGADLIRILKLDDMLLSLPVVIISAKTLKDEELWGADYLKKPVEVDHIIEKVKELCGPPDEHCKKDEVRKKIKRDDLEGQQEA